MNASDDGILALLDAQRPTSRGGRRSKIKKKVSFSNIVEAKTESESKQKDRDQFNREEDYGSDQNEMEVHSFSRPSSGNAFKYGSLDEIFGEEKMTPERLGSKQGSHHLQIPTSTSKYQKENQVGLDSNSDPINPGRDHDTEKIIESRMHKDNDQEPSRQGINPSDIIINKHPEKVQASSLQKDSDTIRLPVQSKSLVESHQVEINSKTLDDLATKLKERLEDTHRLISKELTQSVQEQLVLSLNDSSASGTQQIHSALLRLDDSMKDFRSMVMLDGERTRTEESRLSQLNESLVKGREKTEDTFREKQGVLLEERDLLDQWREKVNRELMHRRGEIEKKEAEVHDIEREIDHRENMFRQQMEHENASTKREKIELKERQQMLIEQEEELKGQRLRIDLQFEEIDAERRRLQDTAEQLSLLSANLAQKANAAERSLFRAEEMAREAKDLNNQLESIQWEKMDLARQRVAFLKERSYSRSQHY